MDLGLVFPGRNILLLIMLYRSDKYCPANIPFYFLSLVSLAGVLILLWLTRWGIAINNDSTVYLASALNYSRGAGLSEWADVGQLKPMTHFPPLYPLLLAYAYKLGLDILVASRWLNALLFGSNIYLAGLLSSKLGRWKSSAFISPLFFLFSTHLLLIHMMAISEPLFILLALLGFWFFIQYMENPSFSALLLSGLFLGLASLSRYIGVAFIIAEVIILLSLRKTANKTTALRLISFISVSFSGIALWVVRNICRTSSTADRSFDIYPVAKLSLLKGVQTILWWLMLEIDMNFIGFMRFILFAVILVFIFKHWSSRVKSVPRKRIPAIFPKPVVFIILCLASYLSMLFVAIIFFDPAITLDYRILSPVYILLLLIFPMTLKSIKLNLLLMLVIALWTASAVAYEICWGIDVTTSVKWNAYQRFNWRKMESLALLGRLPDDAVYLTNDPELLYALSGKIPVLLNRDKLLTLINPEVTSPLTKIKPDTYLVFFKQKVSKPFLPDVNDIIKIPDRLIVNDSPQISIYLIKP